MHENNTPRVHNAMPKKDAKPSAPKQTPEEVAAAAAKAEAAAIAAEQELPPREATLFRQLVVRVDAP